MTPYVMSRAFYLMAVINIVAFAVCAKFGVFNWPSFLTGILCVYQAHYPVTKR